MAHPTLPTRLQDCWEGGFLLVPAQPVRDVGAGGGLIVAGGTAIHSLRPGAQRPRSHGLPPGQVLRLVAVEPWAPFRYAMACTGRLYVFSGGDPDNQICELGFTDPQAEPTHLAWARTDGESVVYFRGRNSEVGRLRPKRHAFEYFDAPPMAAIASDASGVLALLCLVPGEEDVWVSTKDGFDIRTLTSIPVAEPDDDMHMYLAISGPAVAYGSDMFGTYVSWEQGQEDFDYCSTLMWGPIAFHGKDALFCAYSVEEKSTILRRTRQGAVTCIAETGTEWSPEAKTTITALAWDPTRRTLWAASPEMGLLASKEPMPKGKKGVSLS